MSIGQFVVAHDHQCGTTQPIVLNQRKQFVRETIPSSENAAKLHLHTALLQAFGSCKGLSPCSLSRPTKLSLTRQSEQRSVAQVLLARSGECGIALIVWWEVCPHAYCRRLRFLCVWPLITCMRILGFLAFPCILMCSTELGMRMCRVNHFLCPTADGVR